MAPGRPTNQIATKPSAAVAIAEQKKKIESLINLRLQQAPKLLGTDELQQLQKALLIVQERIDHLAGLQQYNAGDFQEMTNIYAEQFQMMDHEYKQLLSRVEKGAKDDLEERATALMRRLENNTTNQKEDRAKLQEVLSELMDTKANFSFLATQTESRNNIIDGLYNSHLHLAQLSDAHGLQLDNISTAISDHTKRLSQTDENVANIFKSMITPYDFKIDAINSKISTQLTAVQTDQTATLNNLKQEQKDQRSILTEHGSLLNTILDKLNSISPTPSETAPYPRPIKTAPTSSPEPATTHQEPPSKPVDADRMSLSSRESILQFTPYNNDTPKTVLDLLREDPTVNVNHISNLIKAQKSIPDLLLTTPPSFETGKSADKFTNTLEGTKFHLLDDVQDQIKWVQDLLSIQEQLLNQHIRFDHWHTVMCTHFIKTNTLNGGLNNCGRSWTSVVYHLLSKIDLEDYDLEQLRIYNNLSIPAGSSIQKALLTFIQQSRYTRLVGYAEVKLRTITILKNSAPSLFMIDKTYLDKYPNAESLAEFINTQTPLKKAKFHPSYDILSSSSGPSSTSLNAIHTSSKPRSFYSTSRKPNNNNYGSTKFNRTGNRYVHNTNNYNSKQRNKRQIPFKEFVFCPACSCDKCKRRQAEYNDFLRKKHKRHGASFRALDFETVINSSGCPNASDSDQDIADILVLDTDFVSSDDDSEAFEFEPAIDGPANANSGEQDAPVDAGFHSLNTDVANSADLLTAEQLGSSLYSQYASNLQSGY
ncbi:unnamed protein product [Ambrosiozyma monospora]|uniref:Unnamed protein product n=1 Tax=Ambrosiozyma monospora TaxID=43982 RepID=A0A9W6YZB0_AMBMO|nr:unnamed protein product [Ambrosiozyma monospora]